MNKTFNFTKQSIRQLPRPKRGMASYRDTKEKGLSLYITSNGAVTFFVRKRINGRDERVRLGHFPEMSLEKARAQALKIKADIAEGKNPNHEKHKLRDEMTFGQLFECYMERYSKKSKRSWRYDEREVNRFLPSWFLRKISTISRHEVRILHEKICEENGLYQANRILERIRAIFNKAIEWGWEGKNPAQGIKKFREKTRDRFIQPGEMPCLFRALEEEESEVARDYVWLSLLTGARKSNVLAMRWDEISWERGEWRIPETKNGEPVTVPLTGKAMEILKARRKKTNSAWVLSSPSQHSVTGHLADPKKAWRRILQRATLYLWEQDTALTSIIKEAHKTMVEGYAVNEFFNAVRKRAASNGVTLPAGLTDIRLHDIRRTVGSYQAITGASLPIIGKSLGHKSQQATQIYSRLHLDPVRASLERATEAMLSTAKRKAG